MKQISRRTIYLGTVLTLLGVTAGMAIASSVLSSTTVNQGANFYQGGNNGANGYSTATLAVSTTPAATSVCTTGTKTGATSAGTVTLILSSTTGGTGCTAGNFAEEFSLSFSATIVTQTNTLSVTTQVGAGTVQTNSEAVTLGTGSSSAFTQTVNVYVDYGSVNPPAGGITVLDLVVQ
jgi:hypothetical protein